MRVFVAGGSGVLGREVIPLLISAGHEVAATTRTPSKAALLGRLGAEPFLLDALDREAVAAAMAVARPDAVMHLLTDLGTGDSASNARLRIIGTQNLVEAAEHQGVRRVVAESISWIYRPGPTSAAESEPLDLDAAEPRRTTIAAVHALETAVRRLPEGVVLRFGQLYGPGTWYARDGRYAREARAGRLPATETVTSFLHVTDAARAALLALTWTAGLWNIVDDEPAVSREWVPVFTAAIGAPRPAFTPSGDPGRPVSNSRARHDGFQLSHPTWRNGFSAL